METMNRLCYFRERFRTFTFTFPNKIPLFSMRFIPSTVHGWLDYLVGAFLIFAPWIFQFNHVPAARNVAMGSGVAAVVYSVFTAYEYGVFPKIPMPVHLMLDGASGILLAASPWLFGFSSQLYLPHVALGLFEIAAALCSKTTAFTGNGRVCPPSG